MADGSEVAIENIKEGDMVQAPKGPSKVIVVMAIDHPSGEIYGFNGGEAFVTENHPFMTKEGWKSINPEMTHAENPLLDAGQLKVGDVMITREGEILIESIEKKTTDIHTVYNINVDGDEVYYADGFLVHNKPQP